MAIVLYFRYKDKVNLIKRNIKRTIKQIDIIRFRNIKQKHNIKSMYNIIIVSPLVLIFHHCY